MRFCFCGLPKNAHFFACSNVLEQVKEVSVHKSPNVEGKNVTGSAELTILVPAHV